ncbi:AraC family transcriptional regulator [Gloeocapsopsis sp. IPPAS B-1203]|uniref:AraC family transcriptional regulator n=1 Tax=Gloeocapsopsis sp. IPPAS B-1203 TaxID=2049454 RepID=UPI000C185C88|nr:AraC family transcriptional regulator [Gloeocapsopsis sp. IPPAS B-1203]PIG92584.1 AraC family transcriptional regulator [Gloeocapsopsis sp. IPPAS B-1203]
MKQAISVLLIRNSIQYAAACGIDPQSLCAAIGIKPSLLEMPDAYVTGEVDQTLWRELVQQTGDQNIGLHIGEKFNLAAIGILGYVLFNCQTFGQVLNKLSRYLCLISQGVEINFTVLQTQVLFEYHVISDWKNYLLEEPRQPIEVNFSALLTAAKTLTGYSLHLHEVWFQYPQPADITEHQRIFQSPILFSQSVNRLIFDAAYLNLPVLSSNSLLLSTFEEHATVMLDTINQKNIYTQQVVREITHCLQGEVPSLEAIARSLAMSVRNLQRELHSEGTSYQQLLDETRKELAMRYLKKQDVMIHDIVFLLGFSEPSAFHRAFKRWTGKTPREYKLNG